MDLQKHLEQEHTISPLAKYLGEVVYGGIDGIITTFAVVAGFAGAGAEMALGQVGPLAVVLFGLANLFGDGVSMALGAYLSTKSEQDIYTKARNKEAHEIKHNTTLEESESIQILNQQGMQTHDAHTMVGIMKKYPSLRVKWMMDNELGLADVREDNALLQGIITLFSFVFFGFIPLVPYVFGWQYNGWLSSIGMTSVALLLLGYLRRYVTRMHFLKTIAQILLLGLAAASVAYATGSIVMMLKFS